MRTIGFIDQCCSRRIEYLIDHIMIIHSTRGQQIEMLVQLVISLYISTIFIDVILILKSSINGALGFRAGKESVQTIHQF